MGASFSSDAIHIQLDRDAYHPGEVVKGVVNVNINKTLQPQALLIKVRGSESSTWWESYGQGSWRYHAKREFFAITIPLASYEGELKPGQYQYPFKFELPTDTPGSFKFKACNRWPNFHSIKANIEYKVEAIAEVPRAHRKDPKFTAEVIVQPRSSKIVEETTATMLAKVTTALMFDKGAVHITATANKNAYLPGESANVVIEIDNQSMKDFSSIVLGVRRSTRLTAQCHGMVANDIISSTTAPGVDHGATRSCSMSVKVPENAQLSTAGQLLSCEYSLEVELKAGAFTSNARLHVPISVYKGVVAGELGSTMTADAGDVQALPSIEVGMPKMYEVRDDSARMRLKAE